MVDGPLAAWLGGVEKVADCDAADAAGPALLQAASMAHVAAALTARPIPRAVLDVIVISCDLLGPMV
jgi:hypothetical protein